jgi:hypothetical protein
MKAVTALLVTVSLTACFPNSAKHRTYAKVGEGAALATGIALLYMANSGADCDEMRGPGEDVSGCRSKADVMSGVGLGLILGGLAGFIATVSTSPDDKPESPANTLTPTPISPSVETPAKDAPATSTAEK